MIFALPIIGVSNAIRLLFVELPRDRQRHQVELCEARIALFHQHGLADDGDDLTRMLACGRSPRRAVKAVERRRRREHRTPPGAE